MSEGRAGMLLATHSHKVGSVCCEDCSDPDAQLQPPGWALLKQLYQLHKRKLILLHPCSDFILTLILVHRPSISPHGPFREYMLTS